MEDSGVELQTQNQPSDSAPVFPVCQQNIKTEPPDWSLEPEGYESSSCAYGVTPSLSQLTPFADIIKTEPDIRSFQNLQTLHGHRDVEMEPGEIVPELGEIGTEPGEIVPFLTRCREEIQQQLSGDSFNTADFKLSVDQNSQVNSSATGISPDSFGRGLDDSQNCGDTRSVNGASPDVPTPVGDRGNVSVVFEDEDSESDVTDWDTVIQHLSGGPGTEIDCCEEIQRVSRIREREPSSERRDKQAGMGGTYRGAGLTAPAAKRKKSDMADLREVTDVQTSVGKNKGSISDDDEDDDVCDNDSYMYVDDEYDGDKSTEDPWVTMVTGTRPTHFRFTDELYKAFHYQPVVRLERLQDSRVLTLQGDVFRGCAGDINDSSRDMCSQTGTEDLKDQAQAKHDSVPGTTDRSEHTRAEASQSDLPCQVSSFSDQTILNKPGTEQKKRRKANIKAIYRMRFPDWPGLCDSVTSSKRAKVSRENELPKSKVKQEFVKQVKTSQKIQKSKVKRRTGPKLTKHSSKSARRQVRLNRLKRAASLKLCAGNVSRKHARYLTLNLRNAKEERQINYAISMHLKELDCLLKHYKREDQNVFKCDVCQRTYGNRAALQKHIILHADYDRYRQSFECHICSEKCKSSKGLVIHYVNHKYDDVSHTCRDCRKRFPSVADFVTHIKSCLRLYACSICGETYSTVSELKRHSLNHKAKEVQQPQGPKRGPANASEMKTQDSVLHGDNSQRHVCQVCDKTFAFKSLLQTHSVAHTGEKPFSCDVCDKKFSFLSGVYTHLRGSHNAIKRKNNYSCTICKKIFPDVLELQSHCEFHTQAKLKSPMLANFAIKNFLFFQGSTLISEVRTKQ